jgi:hypothetical protein
MAKKKPSKKAAAAKKKPAKRTPAAKKTARKPAAKKARKAAPKKAAAKKAAAKKAAPKKAAAKKAAAKKAAPKKAAPKPAAKKAGKAAPRKAMKKPAGKAAPKAPEPQDTESFASAPSDQTVSQAIRSLRATSFASDESDASDASDELASSPVFVETTSAGTQPLAPEHAAVDDLTSSGNELLDIFQKYDRNRTGYLEVPGFARLLEALGQNITDEELQMAFDDIDTERAGKISWIQFKNWWTSR